MKTDEKDKNIISILKQNSRESNISIAKKIGLTEGAVRSRINKLVENKTIQKFTIETNSGSIFGIVMIKAEKSVKALLGEVEDSKIAKESYEISGDYDACVVLEGESLQDIDGKIDELRKLKSVADTRTYISFKKY
ncbi:MAG TPA: Lrp/AsnC family transcriptional regulator [Candidatus Bilamarchaeaceae archaeon]|nr:Lrp/AsnC family transcriptional regulator [Candidatus Bilamarchaeaceae archaeon]